MHLDFKSCTGVCAQNADNLFFVPDSEVLLCLFHQRNYICMQKGSGKKWKENALIHNLIQTLPCYFEFDFDQDWG